MKLIYLIVISFFTMALSACKKTEHNYLTTNNYSNSDSTKFMIGDYFEGGIIFYLDGSGEHGLICATFDIADTVRFFPLGGNVPPETGVLIGTGQANTTTLVNTYGNERYGAYICDTLNLNGFNDWFLPSRDELVAMFGNLYCNGMGNFTSLEYYLSSSRGIAPSAGLNNIINITLQPSQTLCYSLNGWPVNKIRPVRSF